MRLTVEENRETIKRYDVLTRSEHLQQAKTLESRATELRRKSRRIFAWSMVAAVAVHVLILLASPEFRVETREDP